MSVQELAASHFEVSFVHAYPGFVKTSLTREFVNVTRVALNAMLVLAKPWFSFP
jgi:hypothetical protein